MTDILTITLNPALDIATDTAEVIAGPKLRCSSPQEDAGGGGVNVSRAINFLGGVSQAFVALGGFTGQRLQAKLLAENVNTVAFDCSGETRQSFAVTDTKTQQQYRFVLPGAQWDSSITDQALAAIDQAMPEKGLVILSGSFPMGVAKDFVARLHQITKNKHAELMVDTSGDVLMSLVNAPVNLDILRMDRVESEMLAGRALNTHVEAAHFAQSLVQSGVAKMVILARGKEGSCLINDKKMLHCTCTANKVVSAIGAGDSFVGGFSLGLSKGLCEEDALRLGTASASAAVMTKATELCSKQMVDSLLPKGVITELK